MDVKKGLELLRQPFPEHQIKQKPQGTKQQNECLPSEKINCKICDGWHHPRIVHLSYVGHAALTDRLLDADPSWNWEPMAFTPEGLPLFDATGGLWIRLTVCGITRLGYGHAPVSNFKEIGAREKEVIGDALRNAAMRFGAALDLWHKGDLHIEPEKPNSESDEKQDIESDIRYWTQLIADETDINKLRELCKQFPEAAKPALMILAKQKSMELLPNKVS